jgi:5'-nucleotidase
MAKLTIAVDLDTTLNNLEEVWVDRYNRDYNDTLTPDDLVVWDTSTVVKPECGMRIYDYLNEPGFFLNLGIKRDARTVMEYLQTFAEVYIVTAYHHSWCKDKGDWVAKCLPNFNLSNLVFLNDKFMFRADILIDDGAHNIEAYMQDVIVFNAPHNQHLENRFTRVNNWLEIEDHFRRSTWPGAN